MPKKQPKPKKGQPLRKRSAGILPPRERFLIVCEGAKTEPAYFRGFRVPKDVLEVIGAGANTIAVVRRALQERDNDDYDQVWCVFDRDDFPAEHFNEACRLAQSSGIHVAYSNEAFELWFLLHFDFHQAAISRTEYGARLSRRLGVAYAKNTPSMYATLESRMPDAIRNARRLLAQYNPVRPAHDNPATTVHLLVEQLLRFLPRGEQSGD